MPIPRERPKNGPEVTNVIQIEKPTKEPEVIDLIAKNHIKIGDAITKLILFIVGVFLISIIVLVFNIYSKSIDSINLVLLNGISEKENEKEVLDIISAFRLDKFTFLLEFTKIVLINLFLPILTAVIGYTFGVQTRKSGLEKS